MCSEPMPIPVSLCRLPVLTSMYVSRWLLRVLLHHSPTPMHMHIDHQLFPTPFFLVPLACSSSPALASFVPACNILRSTHSPLFWCDLQDATKQFISNNFTCHHSYPFYLERFTLYLFCFQHDNFSLLDIMSSLLSLLPYTQVILLHILPI
jgi:hypothetical protein